MSPSPSTPSWLVPGATGAITWGWLHRAPSAPLEEKPNEANAANTKKVAGTPAGERLIREVKHGSHCYDVFAM